MCRHPVPDHVPPPFAPTSFAHLLDRDPPRAAAILAAMRPPLRAAQAQAHAELVGATADQVSATWRSLIRAVVPQCPPADDALLPHAVVFIPEQLARFEPVEAHRILALLDAPQRHAQAHARWLARFGFTLHPSEILAAWGDRAHPALP